MDRRKTALVFKALGDENRLMILQLLHGGEMCACHLLEQLHISQPTLSHHMKILCDAGIVTGRREGKWMHYSICAQGAETACAALEELLCTAETATNCCCGKE